MSTQAFKFIALAAAVTVAAISCSEAPDAASQTPVDPASGLYEVTFSGAGLLKHAGPGEPRSYCLTEGGRGQFPHILAEGFYRLHPLCTVARGPREGNAFAGEIRCPVDQKMATGASRFIYTGEVAGETARVVVRMKIDADLTDGAAGEIGGAQMKLALKAMESARFVIEAKRTGDCR